MADPADEIDTDADQEPADTGAQEGNETHGDQADARQPEASDQPAAGGDDSDQTSDPLVLAQMEPKAQATPATAGDQPQRKTTPPKPKQPAAEANKPAPTNDKPAPIADTANTGDEQPAQDDPEEAEALADLPDEDWSKVSHKAKSQFLSQRKVLRSFKEKVKAEAEARKQAEDRYQAVEKFVRDQGLNDEEYVNTVAITGLIKRGDPRAIPVLENTLNGLRKAAGMPEISATPASPQLDDDLAAVLAEAEEVGIDTAKVRARFKAPTQQPAQSQPAATANGGRQTSQATHRQATAAAGDQSGAGDQVENQAILDALMGLGVQPAQVVAHVQGLIQADPTLATVPAGQRLRAVLAAHSAAASKAQPQQRQPSQTPLSGRRGPPVPAGRTNTTNADPLKLALPRGR